MIKDWICILGFALSNVFRCLMEYSGYFFCGLFCYFIHNGQDTSFTRWNMIVNGIAAILAMIIVRVVSYVCREELGE